MRDMAPSMRTSSTDLEPACSRARLALPERLDHVGRSPVLDWARSGAMALTGAPSAPPLVAPAAFATSLTHAVDRLVRLAGEPAARDLETLDGGSFLGERAAALDLQRRGACTAGGAGRLLETATVTVALQLAREDDLAPLPAWLEVAVPTEAPWTKIAEVLRDRPGEPLVRRGREIGLPLAAVEGPPEEAPPWVRVLPIGARLTAPRSRARVVDLSSLWAGPLCADLLRRAGADVIKVESTQRPDGARRGPRAFFDLLNADKRSVALDFQSEADLSSLRSLIASADIVVEASRPRALAQLGIDADRCVRERPGTTWISLTAYGGQGPPANWVGFGDDTAVAAGTTAALRDRTGQQVFCGDALADPLTGAHGALAGLASFQAGGGHRLELSLRDVTAAVLVDAPMPPVAPVDPAQIAPPRTRVSPRPAAALGADSAAVLGALPC